MKLPDGWEVRRDSIWAPGGRLLGRTTRYLHKKELLEVRRRHGGSGGHWLLIHQGNVTGHTFKTAKEAVEHAEDVIHHAG